MVTTHQVLSRASPQTLWWDGPRADQKPQAGRSKTQTGSTSSPQEAGQSTAGAHQWVLKESWEVLLRSRDVFSLVTFGGLYTPWLYPLPIIPTILNRPHVTASLSMINPHPDTQLSYGLSETDLHWGLWVRAKALFYQPVELIDYFYWLFKSDLTRCLRFRLFRHLWRSRWSHTKDCFVLN